MCTYVDQPTDSVQALCLNKGHTMIVYNLSTFIWKLDVGVRSVARLVHILLGSTLVKVYLVHVTLTSKAKNFSSPKTP
jgi:thiosulfate reductase cytochrome b subunit